MFDVASVTWSGLKVATRTSRTSAEASVAEGDGNMGTELCLCLDVPCSPDLCSSHQHQLPRELWRAGKGVLRAIPPQGRGSQTSPPSPVCWWEAVGHGQWLCHWRNNPWCKRCLCACFLSCSRPPATTSSHKQEREHFQGFARDSPAALPGRAGHPERWASTAASPRPAGLSSAAAAATTTTTSAFLRCQKRLPGSGRW